VTARADREELIAAAPPNSTASSPTCPASMCLSGRLSTGIPSASSRPAGFDCSVPIVISVCRHTRQGGSIRGNAMIRGGTGNNGHCCRAVAPRYDELSQLAHDVRRPSGEYPWALIFLIVGGKFGDNARRAEWFELDGVGAQRWSRLGACQRPAPNGGTVAVDAGVGRGTARLARICLKLCALPVFSRQAGLGVWRWPRAFPGKAESGDSH
jgi:hypothetical protein